MMVMETVPTTPVIFVQSMPIQMEEAVRVQLLRYGIEHPEHPNPGRICFDFRYCDGIKADYGFFLQDPNESEYPVS